MRIVISSAGRRVYLVRWFQQAIRRHGIHGTVVVFDNDPNAPSVAAADSYRWLPRYEDPHYRTTLLRAVEQLKPHLFISLNDYELELLANGLANDIRALGVIVPSLTPQNHRAVADKYQMFQTFSKAGINTPPTALLTDRDEVEKILAISPSIILKDRYGSGSSGLHHVQGDHLRALLDVAPNGIQGGLQLLSHSELVVQPMVEGQEFGVDIVTKLCGGPMQAVLARKKLAMRSGETTAATTVEATQFEPVASRIAGLLSSQGSIDVDVMKTGVNQFCVIDVNPRFGGGYPYNHVAGADVPGYYVASVLGQPPCPSWHKYQVGARASKHEEVAEFKD